MLRIVGESIRAGDGASSAAGSDWEQFVRASYPLVWRMCVALVGPASADDLAQETFLRATRALPAYRGAASARTWILSIARRACMDELRGRYRRRRRDERLAAVAAEPPPGGDPGDALATHDLLAPLEPERRAAFVLTQLFALSYDEAAEVCGCPVGTIRSRVARARSDLIAQLERHQSSPPRRAVD
jgi:RNA polymerase sigma-70 factor (ECF subfamily)